MIQAMYNGVSGLRAHKTQMDVISNNIANINTIGFKASNVSFREMLSQTIRGATSPTASGMGGTNPMQIGLGTSIGSIDVNQAQGSLMPSGKPSDIAVEGNGFLMVGDGKGKYYTRDGSFRVDANANLVSASGLNVLGWAADPVTGNIDNTAPITASSTIRLPIGQLNIARQTTSATINGIVNSSTPAGGTASSSFEVFDSLGVPHRVDITFTKTANEAEWTWEASSLDSASPTIGSGTISFGTDGRNTVSSGTISLDLASANGASSPIDIALNLGDMVAMGGESSLAFSQNGVKFGTLTGYNIGKDGSISGIFDNGLNQILGQLALAQFSNSSGLQKAGNNLLVETPNSGSPQIGVPGSGSFGNVTSGFLESSNVDLPTEFANMIVAQRGFQANSRIVTTSDEILQELVQLKR